MASENRRMFSSESYSTSGLLDFAREAMLILVPGLELSPAVLETKFKEEPNDYREERTRYGKKEIGYEFIEYTYFDEGSLGWHVGPVAIVNGYGLPENTSLELSHYGKEVALKTSGEHATEVAKVFEVHFGVATEEILDDLVWRAPNLLQYGSWGRAQDIARTILQSRPGDPTGLLVLAIACAAIGEDDEVLKALTQLCSKEPRNVDAMYSVIFRGLKEWPRRHTSILPGSTTSWFRFSEEEFRAALAMVGVHVEKPEPKPPPEKTRLPAEEDALKTAGSISIANCGICRTLPDSACSGTQQETLPAAFTDLLLVAVKEGQQILKCPQCSTYYEYENEALTRLVPTDAISRLAVLHKNELLRFQQRTEVLLQDLARIVVDVNDLLFRPYAARSLIKNLPGTSPAEKLLPAFAENDIEKMQTEIQAGADINHRDPFGLSPIIYASMFGSANIVQLLLRSGADPNITDQNGWTPLMFASLSGEKFVRIATCLLNYGANPNTEPSALKAAVKAENIAAVEVLMSYGADPTAKEKDGLSAIDLAAAAKNPGIKIIIERYSRYFGKGSRPVFVTVKGEPLKTRGADTSRQQIPGDPMQSVQQIAVASEIKLLASSTANEVLIWDLADGRLLHVLSGHYPIAFSDKGLTRGWLASVTSDANLVNRKETVTGEQPSGSGAAVLVAVANLPFRDSMYTADGDRIKIETNDGRVSHVFATPSEIRSIKISGAILAWGGSDGCLYLWDLHKMGFLRALWAGSAVNSVAISNDHRYWIAGCDDGIIRLWDKVSGRPAAQFIYFGDGRWAALTAEGCYNALRKQFCREKHWIRKQCAVS
ncbi:ankyrin repeat domain-containing protein [bacterium]|nr:ankyrin repeat domain-containing protein [bacterium]